MCYLEVELHLACLELLHLGFLEDLVSGGIICLSDVHDLPCNIYRVS